MRQEEGISEGFEKCADDPGFNDFRRGMALEGAEGGRGKRAGLDPGPSRECGHRREKALAKKRVGNYYSTAGFWGPGWGEGRMRRRWGVQQGCAVWATTTALQPPAGASWGGLSRESGPLAIPDCPVALRRENLDGRALGCLSANTPKSKRPGKTLAYRPQPK